MRTSAELFPDPSSVTTLGIGAAAFSLGDGFSVDSAVAAILVLDPGFGNGFRGDTGELCEKS